MRWLLVAVLLAGGGPATAQEQDPVSGTVSDGSPAAGQEVTVAGVGWEPGSDVRLFVAGTEIGGAPVDPEGRFEADVEIPEDAPRGNGTIEVAGRAVGGSPAGIDIPIDIQGRRGLRLGSPIVLILGGIVLILLVVLVVVALSRRGPEP